jgi:hypothetical protein
VRISDEATWFIHRGRGKLVFNQILRLPVRLRRAHGRAHLRWFCLLRGLVAATRRYVERAPSSRYALSSVSEDPERALVRSSSRYELDERAGARSVYVPWAGDGNDGSRVGGSAS